MYSNLVSVIMPTYNSEKYIKDSINSVLIQEYKNWELIIVDDGSIDNTKDIIKQYTNKDERITLIELKKNLGVVQARNIAIQKCKGKYISFLDSDDIWLPDKLKKQILFMIKNDYSFTCTSYMDMTDSGEIFKISHRPPLKTDYKKMILLSDPIGNSTVIIDREKIKDCFVPNIKKRNDFALWLKILNKEKYIYGLQENLSIYRRREDSLSSNKLSLFKYQWKLYKKVEQLSLIKAIFAMLCWLCVKGIKYIKIMIFIQKRGIN